MIIIQTTAPSYLVITTISSTIVKGDPQTVVNQL